MRLLQAHPELDEADLWQAVSQDAEERAAWRHRQQRRRVVARTHARVRWQREDFAHQQSRRIVNAFAVIALEELSVTNMVQDGRLAKSIHDAAWSQVAALIACKAAWADGRSSAVPPAPPPQDCSGGGKRNVDLPLAERVYRRVCCGLVIDRELNASRNVLAVRRHCLGLAS
jgi:putative transposase